MLCEASKTNRIRLTMGFGLSGFGSCEYSGNEQIILITNMVMNEENILKFIVLSFYVNT